MNLPSDRERDLERLLGDESGEFGALYRHLSRMDPPRRLDRAVLGEAARAVQGRAPRRQHWVVGLGSAAGIVLAAGIAWQVGNDALHESSSTRATRESAPMVVPVEPITGGAARKQERAGELDAPAPAAAPPPPPPATAQQSDAAPVMPRRRVPSAKPKAPAVPVQPAPFPAEAESLQEAEPAAAQADTAAEGKAGAADVESPTRQSAPRAAAAPTPSSSAELRRDLQLAPDAWLAHVRDLLEQGRRQQAGESLQLFRRAHPDRPIPDDLRALLD
jgi:hypothetical protein